MNADDLHDLDERGRAAAADLHGTAGSRPMPAFVPGAPLAPAPTHLRPRQGRRLLAAAAVLLTLGAIGAVAVTQGDDGDGPTDEVVTEQPRGWELGSPPAGFELAGAGESVRGDGAENLGTLAAYGPSPDDPQVGVAAMADWSLEEIGATAETFTADGTVAADLGDFGLAPIAVVVDDPASPGDGIVAISATLDREELARILAATTVTDGEARVDASALTDGWELVAEDPSGPFVGNMTAVARGGGVFARSATYLEEAAGEEVPRSLTITARAGDEDQLQLVRLTADEVDEVDQGGASGLLTTQKVGDPGSGAQVLRTLAWQPRPGEIVTINGYGVDADDLLDAAVAARPMAEADWAELVRRSELGLLDQSSGTLIAEGTFEDGTAFALRFDPDGGTVDLNVAVDDDGAGSSGSATASTDMTGPRDATRWIASSTTDIGGRTFDAGLVSADVAFISVRRGDEEVARFDARALDLDDEAAEELGPDLAASRWYAFERPEGADRVVLIRADGTEGPAVPLDGPMITETGPDGSTVTIIEGGG